MWRPIICPRIRCFGNGILSLRWHSSFSSLGPSRGGSAGIFSLHSMPALLHIGISTNSVGHGVESVQPSIDVSGRLCVSSSCISPSVPVQVSGRTCQRSTQTFDSGGTMLDGSSLAPHSSHYVGRHSSVVPYHKRFHCGCLGRPSAQGSAISAFNPLAAQQYVLCRQGFSSSVCQAEVGGNSSIYIKGLPAVLEGMGRLVCLTGCTKQCHLCPKLANFWYIYFRFPWPGMPLVYIVLLFLLFGASSSSQGFLSYCHFKINASFLFTASPFL